MICPALDESMPNCIYGGSLLGVERRTGVLFAPRSTEHDLGASAAQNVGRHPP